MTTTKKTASKKPEKLLPDSTLYALITTILIHKGQNTEVALENAKYIMERTSDAT